MNASASADPTTQLPTRLPWRAQVAYASLPSCVTVSTFIRILLSEEGWTPFNRGVASIMTLLVIALAVVIVIVNLRRATLTGTALTTRGLFGKRRVDLGTASIQLKSHTLTVRTESGKIRLPVVRLGDGPLPAPQLLVLAAAVGPATHHSPEEQRHRWLLATGLTELATSEPLRRQLSKGGRWILWVFPAVGLLNITASLLPLLH